MTVMPLLSRTSPLLVGRQDQLRLLGEHARRCRAETSGTAAGDGTRTGTGQESAPEPEPTPEPSGRLVDAG